MKEDYRQLESKMDHNKDLLIEIKEELVKEISLLKLAQQKLKYSMIIMSLIAIMSMSRPEIVKVLALLS